MRDSTTLILAVAEEMGQYAVLDELARALGAHIAAHPVLMQRGDGEGGAAVVRVLSILADEYGITGGR